MGRSFAGLAIGTKSGGNGRVYLRWFAAKVGYAGMPMRL